MFESFASVIDTRRVCYAFRRVPHHRLKVFLVQPVMTPLLYDDDITILIAAVLQSKPVEMQIGDGFYEAFIRYSFLCFIVLKILSGNKILPLFILINEA